MNQEGLLPKFLLRWRIQEADRFKVIEKLVSGRGKKVRHNTRDHPI